MRFTLVEALPPRAKHAGLLGERVAIVGLSESLGLNGQWGYAISWSVDKQRSATGRTTFAIFLPTNCSN